MSIEKDRNQFKHSKKQKKGFSKMPTWKKALIIALIVLLCLVVAVGSVIGFGISKIFGGFQTDEITDPDIIDVENSKHRPFWN